MKCKNCGAEISNTVKFCPECGNVNFNNEFFKEKNNKKTKEDIFHSEICIIISLVILTIFMGMYLKNNEKIKPVTSASSNITNSGTSVKKETEKHQKTIEEIEKEKRDAIKANEPVISFESFSVEQNIAGTPEVQLVLKNNDSTKTINAYKVEIFAYDNYGKRLSAFGYNLDECFRGISQREIGPGETSGYDTYWAMYGYDNGTKFVLYLTSIHYTDGTEWTPIEGQAVTCTYYLKK